MNASRDDAIDEAREDISLTKAAIECGNYDANEVRFLLHRMEDLNRLTGEEDSERQEYQALLRDVMEQDEATTVLAERWANDCEIAVKPIPQNVAELASRYFGSTCTNENGISAYIRHRLTNYDSLLQQGRSLGFLDYCYDTLRSRISNAIEEAGWDQDGCAPPGLRSSHDNRADAGFEGEPS